MRNIFADELVRVLDSKWMGALSDPYSPAGIVSKLGYNFFLAKGITPTWGELIRAGLRDEGVKEVVRIIGAILLAALLLRLGLKQISVRPAQIRVIPFSGAAR